MPNVRRGTSSEPNPQTASRLLNLPQELQDLIWMAYHGNNKTAYVEYHGEFEETTIVQREYLHDRNLRLACRKINEDVKNARLLAPWSLIVPTYRTESLDMPHIFKQPKLVDCLNRVEQLCMTKTYGCSFRKWSRSDWLPVIAKLPKLRRLEVAFEKDVLSHYNPATSKWVAFARRDYKQQEEAFNRGKRDADLVEPA